MRPYPAVVSLLLTCLLISMVQGVRLVGLDKMMEIPVTECMQEAEGNALITKSIDLCKDGQCSGIRNKEKEKQRMEEEEIKGITQGKNRKLFNTASTSTTTNPTSKNEKNVENENFRVNPRPASEHYDMGDSPKQKPPIQN